MDAVYEEINRDLLHFIAKAPSVFHAVSSIRTALSYAGFTEIREEDPWQLERGGKYVVTRNGSALMAFTIPEDGGNAFRITASHGDSPSFKIKENPELRDAAYVRLNVEGYGGMIMSTWLDRPCRRQAASSLRKKENSFPNWSISIGRHLSFPPSPSIWIVLQTADTPGISSRISFLFTGRRMIPCPSWMPSPPRRRLRRKIF